ncbi:hypothetical protein QJS66_07550 [Kocuria rhizophila]|nr:hypothetical protein QJS66_07550 [Kocuria rhizophila]
MMERSDIPWRHGGVWRTPRSSGGGAGPWGGRPAGQGLRRGPPAVRAGRVSSDVDALTRPSRRGPPGAGAARVRRDTVSTFHPAPSSSTPRPCGTPAWGPRTSTARSRASRWTPRPVDQLWAQRLIRLVAGYPCDGAAYVEHALIILVYGGTQPRVDDPGRGHLAEVLTRPTGDASSNGPQSGRRPWRSRPPRAAAPLP